MKSFKGAPARSWVLNALPLALAFAGGLGAVILGHAGSASAAGNADCVDCQSRSRQSPLTSAGDSLGTNIAAIINRSSSLVGFPQAPLSKAPLWDGQGDLPGAFKAPWQFAKTDFDPSFRTSYWSDETGPLNVSSAPWAQGMSTPFREEMYGYGMVYVGTPYQAPLALDFAPMIM